jgi:hypothetical protein
MTRGVGEVSGVAALAWVGGTGLALLVTAAVFYLCRRALRRRETCEQAALEADLSAARPGIVALAGTIEALDGEDPPVAVTVEEAKEAIDWKETGRRVEARPFVLRLASGARVEVQPGEAPLLRDALDVVEQLGRENGADRRRRTARLAAGERVFVRGLLRAQDPADGGGPYRATAERAVIGPPPRGRMVLSTEALTGELGDRATGLEFQLGALVATFVVSQLLYVGFYIDCARHWLGRAGPPTILFDLFFWVLLGAVSVIIGSVAKAWNERPMRQ